MRCFICNGVLTEVNFNRDHEDIDPCPECIAVIQDTIAGYHDRPSVDEDELGGPETPLEGALQAVDYTEDYL